MAQRAIVQMQRLEELELEFKPLSLFRFDSRLLTVQRAVHNSDVILRANSED
jgi:hypothetical protein